MSQSPQAGQVGFYVEASSWRLATELLCTIHTNASVSSMFFSQASRWRFYNRCLNPLKRVKLVSIKVSRNQSTESFNEVSIPSSGSSWFLYICISDWDQLSTYGVSIPSSGSSWFLCRGVILTPCHRTALHHPYKCVSFVYVFLASVKMTLLQ